MNLPVSRLLISTFLSPILDWTVAIVRLAIMADLEKEEAPLMMCVETILVVRRYFVLRLLEGCRPMETLVQILLVAEYVYPVSLKG